MVSPVVFAGDECHAPELYTARDATLSNDGGRLTNMSRYERPETRTSRTEANEVLFRIAGGFSGDRLCVASLHVGFRDTLHHHKSSDGFVDTCTCREQAVIAKNNGAIVSQGFRDEPPATVL